MKDNEDESRELVLLSELTSLSINDKVNVCGKVMELKNVVERKKGDGSSILKRDSVFGDNSCSVRLVLWEGDINKLAVGNSYRLVNVCVRQWQGVSYLSLSADAIINALADIGEVEDNVISSTKSKEICSEVLAVLNVVIYLACWLCNSKIAQEESLSVCSKCGAVMKTSRCKHSLIVEFSIDGYN